MWDMDSIYAMIDEFKSFEIHVSTPDECDALIHALHEMGFTGGTFMVSLDGKVPYPYFRIRMHTFGGNYSWKDADKPHFEYSEFVSKFKLDFCEEDNITTMDSVI